MTDSSKRTHDLFDGESESDSQKSSELYESSSTGNLSSDYAIYGGCSDDGEIYTKPLDGQSGSDSQKSSDQISIRSTETTSDELGPLCKKPRLSSESEATSGCDSTATKSTGESRSPELQKTVNIPKVLSSWNRQTLDDLNIAIVFQPNTKPLAMMIGDDNFKEEEEDDVFLKIRRLVKRSPLMKNLNCLKYTSFDDLDSEKVLEIDPDDEKSSYIPDAVPESLRLWFYRFHTNGKEFINLLNLMLKRREKGSPLLERHFQYLFETFAAIFGMSKGISFAPCLDVQTKKVCGTIVNGAADIVFARRKFSSRTDSLEIEHPSVIALCEVKKACPKICNDIDSPNRKTPAKAENIPSTADSSSSMDDSLCCASHSETRKHPILQHVDSNLIGQHGGELLFSFPNSIHNKRVFGLIVQQTKVTFTVLQMTKKQYYKIMNGTFQHGIDGRPTLTFSRPCDYLNPRERKHVIDALIKFGMLQRKNI